MKSVEIKTSNSTCEDASVKDSLNSPENPDNKSTSSQKKMGILGHLNAAAKIAVQNIDKVGQKVSSAAREGMHSEKAKIFKKKLSSVAKHAGRQTHGFRKGMAKAASTSLETARAAVGHAMQRVKGQSGKSPKTTQPEGTSQPPSETAESTRVS